MCKHEYAKLGYLMVYGSSEFSPIFMVDNPEIGGCYSAYTGVAKNILVYQCIMCGKVKLSNGVLEKICQRVEID